MAKGKSLTPAYRGEDVLFKQYGDPAMRGCSLTDYLEGLRVPDAWIDAVEQRVATQQPETLYRLCIVPQDTQLGTRIRVDKRVVSTSDRRKHAVYAGCSYHHDQETELGDQVLALIVLKHVTTCVSFLDIRRAVKQSGFYAVARIAKEREYLVRGPVEGEVIELFDVAMVLDKSFKKLL